MQEYFIPSVNGENQIHCCEWKPEGEVKAIVQIAHGMSEHIERYGDFAEYLNGFGILLAGNDHIGHGQSCDYADWGYFGPEGGWQIFINDIENYRKYLDEKYPGVKHVLLGHSMGSFISRCYLAKYGHNLNAAIIMGTAGKNPAVGIGKLVVSVLRKIKGDRHKSKLITAMAFGSYFKRLPNAKTQYDWLTRDDAVVEKYCNDPACGFTFTLAGYADLFNLLEYISKDECVDKTPKDIPIFVVAGEEDPVGNYGKGPKDYFDALKSKDSKVDIKLYPEMRHEILNEFGKEEVYQDIKDFVLNS